MTFCIKSKDTSRFVSNKHKEFKGYTFEPLEISYIILRRDQWCHKHQTEINLPYVISKEHKFVYNSIYSCKSNTPFCMEAGIAYHLFSSAVTVFLISCSLKWHWPLPFICQNFKKKKKSATEETFFRTAFLDAVSKVRLSFSACSRKTFQRFFTM